MIAPEELRHVVSGPREGEMPGGIGLVVVTGVSPVPAEVLRRCREAMVVVIEHQLGEWPDEADWRRMLPVWFVSACADEMTPDEADRWLAWWQSLSPDERAVAETERRWPLADWLYWLAPDERQWFWWDGAVADVDCVQVSVEVSGWPAPLGALEWLLRAAGANDVVAAEDVSA